jgi:CubicO group peptidase (beta-lactamase class C family)
MGTRSLGGACRRVAVGLAELLACALLVGGCDGSEPERDPSGFEEIEGTVSDLERDVTRMLTADDTFDLVRAILVRQDGQVLFEGYFDSHPRDHSNVMSVTKSVVSTLVGIAVGEGRLALDDPLAQLLPAYAGKMSPAVAGVTLEQLLTMTAGFSAQDSAEEAAIAGSPDPVATAIRLADGPSQFAYTNAGVHVLSAVLDEAVGGSVLHYARSRLFDPLGIDTHPAAQMRLGGRTMRAYTRAGFAWPVDKQGRHLGFAFLKLRAEDLARLGQTYLDGGVWDGRQVVPAGWVEEATTAQVDAPAGLLGGYGYLWWVGEVGGDPAFAAVGYGGQLVLVVPSRDLVVVVVTELRLDQPASPVTRGLSFGTVATLVESGIVANVE